MFITRFEFWGYALALSIEVFQEFLIHSCTCISRSNIKTSTDNNTLTVMTPTKVPNHWGSTMFWGWDRTFEFECGELEIGFALIGVVFNRASKVIRQLHVLFWLWLNPIGK